MKKDRMKVVLITTSLSVLLMCTSCTNRKSQDVDDSKGNTTEASDSGNEADKASEEAYFIEKLAEVRSNFSSLYSSQALGEDTMIIDEVEIDAETSMGTSIRRFSDKDKQPLRYIITYYGETGQKQVDYYVDNFGLFVSEINMYYASQTINSDYLDPLYTEVTNYCIKDDKVYELEKDGATLSDKLFDYSTVQQLDDLYASGEKEDVN